MLAKILGYIECPVRFGFCVINWRWRGVLQNFHKNIGVVDCAKYLKMDTSRVIEDQIRYILKDLGKTITGLIVSKEMSRNMDQLVAVLEIIFESNAKSFNVLFFTLNKMWLQVFFKFIGDWSVSFV